MVLCLPTAVRAQTHDSTIAGWVVSNATLPHDAPASASGIQLIKGIAYYPDANFRDGTIEFDLAPAGTAFTGIAFRMRSAANYEIVYFRPDSGRWARIQYQPVFEGETTWQLYHGDGYEGVVPHASSGPLHVKILVAGSRAQVYVGCDTTPALVVRELKRSPTTGGIGFWVAGGSKGDGVNGGISKLTVQFASPRLAMPPRETHPPEQLLRWLVSPRMPSDSIDTPETPPAMIADAGKWKIVDAEGSGLINLTRAVGIRRVRSASTCSAARVGHRIRAHQDHVPARADAPPLSLVQRRHRRIRQRRAGFLGRQRRGLARQRLSGDRRTGDRVRGPRASRRRQRRAARNHRQGVRLGLPRAARQSRWRLGEAPEVRDSFPLMVIPSAAGDLHFGVRAESLANLPSRSLSDEGLGMTVSRGDVTARL